MLQTIIIPLAFAGVTFAAVLSIGSCPPRATTYTASAAPFYYGAPVLDTAVASCNSTDTTTCALGVSASTSAGYTITMGAGLTLDLYVHTWRGETSTDKNRPEIGSIAFNPSVGYSYTRTKGTSDGYVFLPYPRPLDCWMLTKTFQCVLSRGRLYLWHDLRYPVANHYGQPA